MKEQNLHEVGQIWTACLKTPIITFCLTILMDLNFVNFLVQTLSYPPRLQGEALGSTAVIIAPGHKDPLKTLI